MEDASSRDSVPAAVPASLVEQHGRRPVAAPAARAPGRASRSFPIIVCPECGALEPAGFVGGRSGEVVRLPSSAFSDRAGFTYCDDCGAVWNTLYLLPEGHTIDPSRLPPKIFADDHLSTGAPFNPYERGVDFRFFRKLARTHIAAASRSNSHALTRARDRTYDAEALCSLLDLPADVKTGVLYHVRILSERADLRALSTVACDGKTRTLRAETITIGLVAAVMDRFGVWRGGLLPKLLGAFSFKRGPPITKDDFFLAYGAVSTWFDANLWRND